MAELCCKRKKKITVAPLYMLPTELVSAILALLPDADYLRCRVAASLFCCDSRLTYWTRKHARATPSTVIASGSAEGALFLIRRYGLAFTGRALAEAAARGHLDLVRFLHRRQTREQKEECACDAVGRAAMSDHVDIVSFLCEQRSEGFNCVDMIRAASVGSQAAALWMWDKLTMLASRSRDAAVPRGRKVSTREKLSLTLADAVASPHAAATMLSMTAALMVCHAGHTGCALLIDAVVAWWWRCQDRPHRTRKCPRLCLVVPMTLALESGHRDMVYRLCDHFGRALAHPRYNLANSRQCFLQLVKLAASADDIALFDTVWRTVSPVAPTTAAEVAITAQTVCAAAAESSLGWSIIERFAPATVNGDTVEVDLRDALVSASARGHSKIVDALLERRVRDERAMVEAAAAGHVGILERLFCAGMQCPVVAFDQAASYGRMYALVLLLHRAPGQCGVTALDAAVRNGHDDVVGLLLSAYTQGHDGAGIFGQPRETLLALDTIDVAASCGHTRIVRRLVRYGWTWSRDTVDAAAAEGHTETLSYLWTCNCPWAFTETAVDLAAEGGHADTVRFLVDCGVPGTTEGVTAAALGGHLDVLKVLYDALLIADEDAMDAAASRGHLHIVEWLHHSVGAQGTKLAADMAITNNHLEVVRFLWAHSSVGCSPHVLASAPHNGGSDAADARALAFARRSFCPHTGAPLRAPLEEPRQTDMGVQSAVHDQKVPSAWIDHGSLVKSASDPTPLLPCAPDCPLRQRRQLCHAA